MKHCQKCNITYGSPLVKFCSDCGENLNPQPKSSTSIVEKSDSATCSFPFVVVIDNEDLGKPIMIPKRTEEATRKHLAKLIERGLKVGVDFKAKGYRLEEMNVQIELLPNINPK